MGRATRWLKGLFGIKNNKDNRRPSDDPKRPSITGLCYNDIETLRTNLSVAETDWKRSYCSEEEKHTMAVVAATAAATDAAVAAARAAVAVVRLTSSGGASLLIGRSRGESEAAVKIQTFFRGFLAKKALRALKGLVKLQALVRGHLVRKQAMLTLKNMQALMRAQSTARSRRSHRVIKNLIDHRSYKSAEKFGGAQGGEPGETVAAHTRRLSASSMPPRTGVESINGRRNSTSRRKSSPSLVDFTDYPCYKPESSPLPCHQFSGYTSTPSHFNFLQELQYEEFRRCSSVQSTPRFSNTTESNDVFVFPSYMANTQSFRAKSRSSSAPKQRLSGGISRVSLHEMMFSRSSFSGVRMQRSCSKAQEAINLKNGISQKPPYE